MSVSSLTQRSCSISKTNERAVYKSRGLTSHQWVIVIKADLDEANQRGKKETE